MVVTAAACALRLAEPVLTCVFLLLDAVLGLVYYPYLWAAGRPTPWQAVPPPPPPAADACRTAAAARKQQHDDADAGLGAHHAAAAAAGVKTVVIVGGSFAGLTALRHLQGRPGVRVVLVDQRAYYEYVPGVLRLFCDPSLHASIAKPMPTAPHTFVHGVATEIGSRRVVVRKVGHADAGATVHIDFDHLIIATGADYRTPITPRASESRLDARAATWRAQAAALREASSVLVLGGGAVGTELAAEILCHYPDKHLTIVDGKPHLVPLFPRSTTRHAERWFRERGAELVLGEMLSGIDAEGCTLKESGRRISADVVFVCFGMRCNTAPVRAGDMASALDPRGAIRVNACLQVEGFEHVFAVGDAMAHPAREIKQAYYAELNGKAAAQNVLRMVRGEPLCRYPEDIVGAPVSPLVYVVSLGRYDGSLGFNQLTINGPLAALVKFVLEWTKVKQMQGRPVGLAIWKFGDAMSFVLSRTLLRPKGC